MGRIILDLCGGTGAWSKPYKDAGYDVQVITLPEFDVTEYDIEKGNLLFFDGDRIITRIRIEHIYGILAAPPCTMFSRVRTTAKEPRDFLKGMLPVRACLEIIWACQYEKHKLAFWAMENPNGYLRRFLGYPPYTFDPTEFGDPHNKRTDLWGYFKPPKKTRIYRKTKSHAVSNDHFEDLPIDYVRDPNMRLDAIKRSITPPGFAKAFMEANK